MKLWAIGFALLVVALTILYRKTIRPMRIVKRGMDLVREQDFASRLRRVGQRDADRLVDMFNDMMDRLKHERLRVREQNEFLDLLINASTTGILLLDGHGSIRLANRAATEMLNCRAADAGLLEELDSPVAQAATRLAMRETATVKIEERNEIFRITKLGFMDRGWLHPFILIERLTDEIHEAERNAYTRVIRMMAHEVNNSVGGISSALQTIESELRRMEGIDNRFTAPLRACTERAESLMGFIQAYAKVIRVPEPALMLTDYYVLAEASLPLLESICNQYGAQLTASLDDAEPLRLDPVLMQQVMVNVIKNAAENAGRGGHVDITARGRQLTVTNDGPPIAPDLADKLFTDICTTKPDGHGLGLMLVGEILRKHGARFSLRSSDGLTRFTMQL